MISYINNFKENKKSKKNTTTSLRVKDKKLFKKYKNIWKKNERLTSIDFESQPSYGDDDDDDDDDKYIKTKIKIYNANIMTNFH